MNIGYLIAGCIFLFNPTVNLIDVLPDVIGYLLILKGLDKLSDLDGRLRLAKQKFKAAAWIAGVKFLVMFLTPVMDSTWYLLLAFSFGVLELIYGIPAFVGLFGGISYLEMRHTKHKTRRTEEAKPLFGGTFDKTEFADGTAYFELYERRGTESMPPSFEETVSFADGTARLCVSDAGFSSRTNDKTVYLYESDEARVISVIFVAVRAVCACLPEITALFGIEPGAARDYTGVRSVLAVLFGVVSLVFGVIWLVRMLRYFTNFQRDTRFVSALEEKYAAEILTDELLWTKRKTSAFCSLSIVAFVFFLCMPFDGVLIANHALDSFFFMPEFLWGAVMTAAFYAAGEYAPRRRVSVIKTSLFLIFSAVSYGLLIRYSEKYAVLAFPFQGEGFLPLYAAYMGFFVLAFVMYLLLIPEKRRVYLCLAQRAAEMSSSGLHEMAERKKEETLRGFRKAILCNTVLESVYAAVSIACMAVVPLSEEYAVCGLSWLLRLLFGVVLMISGAVISGKLNGELERVI